MVHTDKIEIMLNPLAFTAIEEPWTSALDAAPASFEDFIRYLCKPGISPEISELINRYNQINLTSKNILTTPNEPHILEKLIFPLKDAKGCFMIGNYLGTIALCGMVAEMVAIIYFETADISINEKPMDEATQKSIFGSTFEKLGQDKRGKVLKVLDIIDDEILNHFDTVREMRRRYLHFYSQNHNTLANDAITAYDASVKLVSNLIGATIVDSKTLVFSKKFLNYLRKINFIDSSA